MRRPLQEAKMGAGCDWEDAPRSSWYAAYRELGGVCGATPRNPTGPEKPPEMACLSHDDHQTRKECRHPNVAHQVCVRKALDMRRSLVEDSKLHFPRDIRTSRPESIF